MQEHHAFSFLVNSQIGWYETLVRQDARICFMRILSWDNQCTKLKNNQLFCRHTFRGDFPFSVLLPVGAFMRVPLQALSAATPHRRLSQRPRTVP